MDNRYVCPNCKEVLPPGSSFCARCGRRVFTQGALNDKDYRGSSAGNSVYLRSGTVLQEKYRINRVLGQGGFGITYDGTDLKLDRHVAVKEYYPTPIADRPDADSKEVTCSHANRIMFEHGMKNFLKEARNMAKFAGEENFVSVHDYFTENNTAYIIMEYVEGQNLKQYMRRYGPLSMEDAMMIVIPVMNALEKIHSKGLVHRDVSPSNIMVRQDGRIKLLDFGAVRDISIDSQNLTTMSAVYKLGYSPIEQQTRDMPQGTYSDIYALCATLYEMLTGSIPPSPFSRLSGRETLVPPSAMGVKIFPAQEKGLLKGLEIYGKDRIQTISELRSMLCSGEDPRSVPVQNSTNSRKGIHPFIPVGIAAVLIMLLAFSTIHFFNRENKKSTVQSADSTIAEQEETEPGTTKEEAAVWGTTGEETVEWGTTGEAAVTDPTNDTTANSSEEEPPIEEGAERQEEKKEFDYPEGTLSYRGHHYYIYSDVKTSWEEAMANCRRRGGYLAVINDAEENEELYQYMVNMGYKTAYFGLYYNNGTWEYLFGDTSDYRDWGFNSKGIAEPNNDDGGEIHAALDIYMHNGYWNDVRFGRTDAHTPDGHKYTELYRYICEWGE